MTGRVNIGVALTLGLLVCVSAFPSQAQDLEPLKIQLSSRKSEERRNAVHALRAIGTEEASRAAAPALRDGSEAVRATAVMAVLRLPTEEAAALLIPLLSDGSAFVRKEASVAVGMTRSRNGARALSERLQKEKNREVRAALAVGLGLSGDVSAIDRLIAILKTKPVEDDEFIRRSAARSIGQLVQMGQTGSIDATTPRSFLEKIPQPAPERKRVLVDTSEAGRILIRVIADSRESEDTRREAVYALGVIGDSSFRDVIEPLSRSEDPYLARIAIEALARLDKGGN